MVSDYLDICNGVTILPKGLSDPLNITLLNVLNRLSYAF
jgi:hypothetical protein